MPGPGVASKWQMSAEWRRAILRTSVRALQNPQITHSCHDGTRRSDNWLVSLSLCPPFYLLPAGITDPGYNRALNQQKAVKGTKDVAGDKLCSLRCLLFRIVIVKPRSTSRRLPVAAGAHGTRLQSKGGAACATPPWLKLPPWFPYGPLTVTSFEQFMLPASHTLYV